MNDNFYKKLMEQSPAGYAYHKIICDETGKPCDYEFIEVNPAFEELTGMKGKDIIGKPITEVLPEIKKSEFDWIRCYGEIALKDGKKEFEQFSEPLNKWYRVNAHSPEKGSFITVFTDITNENRQINELQKLNEALKESQFIMKDILETTLSGFWDWNLVDNTEYLSPTFKRMFGYEDYEMESSPEAWQRIIFPEDLPKVLEVFDRHVKSRGREPFYNEIRYRHRDGSTVWVICAGRVIEWAEDGTALRMIGCHIDITERKQAVEQLMESQEMISAIVETSQDWIWAIDIDGKYTFSNATIQQILGLDPYELIGETHMYLLHEEDYTKVQAMLPECIHEQRGWSNLILRWRNKDDAYRYLESNAMPIIDSTGTLIGFRGVDRDITERKLVEEKIVEQNSLLEKLPEQVPGVIYQYRYHPDGRNYFPYTSSAIWDIYEVTPEEVKLDASKVLSRLHPDDYNDVMEGIVESSKTLENWEDEYRVILPKKGERWVSGMARPEKLEDGSVLWHGYISDITERKQAEFLLRKSEEKHRVLFEQSVNAISKIGEIRDMYTAGHSKKVMELSCAIALEMGLSDEVINNISFGALIHDIGKIYIASDILNKPGKISNLEYQIIQNHVKQGYDVVKEIDFPSPVIEMIHQHHERMDGSGYPQKLVGDQIIIEGRILAVADVVEAMSSHRPYRPALGIDKALEEVLAFRGKRYDCDVVDACVRLFREKSFEFTIGD